MEESSVQAVAPTTPLSLFIFRQCQHQLLSLLQLLWLLSRKVVRLVEEKCKIG
jgi:hypothetical protein